MSDNTITIANRTFKAVPTSCRCGGSWAWVEVNDGVHTMIGCVCHHTLPVNDEPPTYTTSEVAAHLGLKDPSQVELVPDDCTCYDVNADFDCPVHGGY